MCDINRSLETGIYLVNINLLCNLTQW